ncbi:MAG: ATP-binding cassette domain-containing protein [Planctomycetota bacterium]
MSTISAGAGEERCVTVLVRLARQMNIEAEHLRAKALVREAAATWSDAPEGGWWRWLSEAGTSLGIRSRVADLTLEQAMSLSRDGGLLTARCAESGELILLVGSEGATARVAVGELDGYEDVPAQRLAERVGVSDGGTTRWLIAQSAETHGMAVQPGGSTKPQRRLFQIMRPELGDIWIVVVFAFFVGVLNLATPIAVEALVNTVAFGQLLQPVLVLSVLLMAFLMFAGAVIAVQTFAVEIIQRRLFARVAADLAYRLPRVKQESWDKYYAPELVNRFFDVTTLQKVTANLLLDGVMILLSTLIGMAVLGFYHPWLLGFDVLLLLTVVGGILVLGRGAIRTGIEESKQKYKLAGWLEDVARCSQSFKLEGGSEFASDRANFITSQYLTSRQQHFRILFRQILFVLGLQAVAGTVLLGVGGWLVIDGQLTLGQLVAAELIVAAILGSLAKLGKHLEGYYDLIAGIDKLGKLFDLPLERHDGLLEMYSEDEAAVRLNGVNCKRGSSDVFEAALDLELPQGSRLAVVGPPGSGKTTLLETIYGLRTPSKGRAEVLGVDPGDVRPDVLRRHVVLARNQDLFEGTLAENIHLHRPNVTSQDVRDALDAVGLLQPVLRLPKSLETDLVAGGSPLTDHQKHQLLLARAIASRSPVLLIDGLLDRLDGPHRNLVLDSLESFDGTTVILTTGRDEVVAWCGETLVLGPLARSEDGNEDPLKQGE